MKNRTKSFIYAAIIGLIIVAIFLGFLSSIFNPISWLLIAVLVLIHIQGKKEPVPNLVQWKQEYSVGIDHIDKDHKKLISLLNQLNTAYEYAMSESFEKEALEDLVKYTKYHFEREEKLMAESDYPDLESHKKQHQEMIDKVDEFINLYNEQGHECLHEISTYLTDWLLHHIAISDNDYSDYIQQRVKS